MYFVKNEQMFVIFCLLLGSPGYRNNRTLVRRQKSDLNVDYTNRHIPNTKSHPQEQKLMR